MDGWIDRRMDDKQKGRWIDDGWIDKCKWMDAPEV